MSETVGFIGLGNMGEPIALNLLRAGYRLRVYNRTKSKAAPLEREGAAVVESPADVAMPGGIVLTVLSNDRALEEVCYAQPSFVERLGSGGLHVSLSTISPATARKLAKDHSAHGVSYVASPVLGRPEAAEAKNLFVYTSGPAEAKKRAQPVHVGMSQGVFDFGEDPGAANVVKLCANFLVAASIEALAELLTLAEKNGVSKKSVAEMIDKFSPLHAGYVNIMTEGRFEPAAFSFGAWYEGRESDHGNGRLQRDALTARQFAARPVACEHGERSRKP